MKRQHQDEEGELEVRTRSLQPVSLLVSLIHSAAEFNRLATSWKLSNKERNLGLLLAAHRKTAIQEHTAIGYFQDFLVNKVDLEWVLELAQYCEKMEYISALKHWEVPVMPVTGHDLIAAGIQAGPRLGPLLNVLKMKWMESGYVMGKDELLERLEEVVRKEEEAKEDVSKRRKLE